MKSCNYYVMQVALLQTKHKLDNISFNAMDYSFIEEYVRYLRATRKLAIETTVETVSRMPEVIPEVIDEGNISKDPFFV